MTYKPPDTRTWWKNRRKHSYFSLVGLFVIGIIVLLGDPKQIEAASPVLQTLTWVFGLIILTYVSASTIEDIVKLKEFK